MKFRPKKERSKSTPALNNMGMRLRCLKDIKEDLMMGRSPLPNEIRDSELELQIPVLAYNYNFIGREILPKALMIEELVPKLKKRRNPSLDCIEPANSQGQE